MGGTTSKKWPNSAEKLESEACRVLVTDVVSRVSLCKISEKKHLHQERAGNLERQKCRCTVLSILPSMFDLTPPLAKKQSKLFRSDKMTKLTQNCTRPTAAPQHHTVADSILQLRCTSNSSTEFKDSVRTCEKANEEK